MVHYQRLFQIKFLWPVTKTKFLNALQSSAISVRSLLLNPIFKSISQQYTVNRKTSSVKSAAKTTSPRLATRSTWSFIIIMRLVLLIQNWSRKFSPAIFVLFLLRRKKIWKGTLKGTIWRKQYLAKSVQLCLPLSNYYGRTFLEYTLRKRSKFVSSVTRHS